MKKIYFSSAFFAFLLSCNLSAQSVLPVRHQQQADRSRVEIARTPFHHHAKKATAHFTKAKAEMDEIAPCQVEVAPVAPNLLDEDPALTGKKDTLLLMKHVSMEDNKETVQVEYTYDEYGYRKTSIENIDDAPYYRSYKYEVGPFNYWVSKEIMVRDDLSKPWVSYSKEERTINEKKQLTSSRLYDVVDGKYLLREETKYDYAHPYYLENGNKKVLKVGATVYHARYDENGKLVESETFDWMDAAQQYVLVGKEKVQGNEGRVKESEIKGDELITKCYNTKNGNKQLYQEDHKFFGWSEGGYSVHMDADGNPTRTEGQYTKAEMNSPAKGNVTTVSYEYKDNKAVPRSRNIYVGFNKDKQTVSGTDWSKVVEEFDDDSGEWVETETESVHYFNDVIYLKNYCKDQGYSHPSYGVDLSPEQLEALGISSDEGDIWVYYDDKTKIYTLEYEDTDNCEPNKYITLYRSYNLKNEQVALYKLEEVEADNVTEAFLSSRMYEWKDNVWTPLRHMELNYYEMEDGKYRDVYDMDEKGNPLHIQSFYEVDGKKRLIEDIFYKFFGDTDYLYTCYEYMNSNEEYVKDMFYKETEEFKMFTDGSYQVTDFEYKCSDESAKILFGKRYDVKTNGLIINSKYNTEENKFVESGHTTYDERTYDEKTNLITKIKRVLDDNNNVVMDSKFVNTPYTAKNMYRASYEWDNTAKEWVGIRKMYGGPRDFELPEIKRFRNVFDYNDNANLIMATENNRNRSTRMNSSGNQNFSVFKWNRDKKDWEAEHIETLEMLSQHGNSYSLKQVLYDEGEPMDQVSIYNFTLNDDNRIIKLDTEETVKENGVTTTKKSAKEFAYNKYGYVTEFDDVRTDNGKKIHEHNTFVFQPFQLTPVAITNVKGDVALNVKGRNIEAADGALVEVYDMSGRKVLSGKGHVTLPAAGLYVVKSGNVNAKVCCK